MAALRFHSSLALGAVLACSICFSAPCLGQGSDRDVDDMGCPKLAVFPKLVTSVVVSCQRGESVEVTMPLKPDAQGFAREKSIRGVYEFREYQIKQVDQQEHAFENLMQLAAMAGFTVKYSAAPSTITARNGDTWVLVNVSGEYYDAKVVRAKEDPLTPVQNAQEISREMEAHKRAAIYGIFFSPDSQAVVEQSSPILGEVLTYLKKNPGMTLDIESHMMSNNGNEQGDQEITGKRAKAVVGWLQAHGVTAVRLQPKALGRNKPITENDTALEILQNERIELVKTAP
jgi:outer membrane protein OmpA-like peptidoglycan-associated protein